MLSQTLKRIKLCLFILKFKITNIKYTLELGDCDFSRDNNFISIQKNCLDHISCRAENESRVNIKSTNAISFIFCN